MRYFDLHCDTLYRATTESKTMDSSELELSFNISKSMFKKWYQCTAIWIPDELNDMEAMEFFEKSADKLKAESKRLSVPINDINAPCSFIFTVENAKVLSDDINNIYKLKEKGVRMITLTWNDENNLGGGVLAQETGLKPFGRKCIFELEKNDIIVDISHASDKLFYDVAETAQKPFVASHSNSRSICNNLRNLTDEQFSVMVKKGGLVGLNFHKNFLSEDGDKACIDDVIRHAYHFLSLGGENILAIGSDFDGADMPADLNSTYKITILAETFIKRGFNEQIVQKIIFDNAHNFFSKF